MGGQDRVSLRNMQFFAYHGVFEGERTLGQRFEVDVDLFLDTRAAAASDDLTRAVNYVDVYELVGELMEGEPFRLLEAAADAIARGVLTRFDVPRVTVRLRKPSVALGGVVDYAEVELTRTRS